MSTALLQQVRATDLMRRTSVGRMLYNAGDEFIEFGCAGEIYVIPPDGPGRLPSSNVVTNHDGILIVEDRYGVSPTARKRERKTGQVPVPDLLITPALDIVAHALKKLSNRGVVFLTGNPEEDEPAKRAAKETWIAFKVRQCESIISNYHKRTEAFRGASQNAGRPAPPMDDREMKAQMWLDDYRLGNVSMMSYICRYNCGFQCDDIDIMERHYRASHPMAAAEAGYDEATSLMPQQGPDGTHDMPRRRGRPPKIQQAP